MSVATASDVFPFFSGPLKSSPKRRYCSSPTVGANALRAFIASSRNPTLVMPRQSSTPGFVMMSMPKPPDSWFSAAYEFMRKRIWRIWFFGGRRPPRKPFTRIVAPGPAIWLSIASSSSGSSGSSAISASVSVLVKELPRRSLCSWVTTTCSVRPASGSLMVTALAPFFSVTGPSNDWNASASTLSVYSAAARSENVATPLSSTCTVRGAPAASTTVIRAMTSAAPV